jgi:hypothetical protein
MKEPRRLNRSGGVSQRLLDSASLDKPGASARRHAASLAATASAFTRTNSGSSGVTSLAGRRAHPAKTLATWIAVGAAASVTLGLVGTKLLDSSSSHNAAAPLATLSAAPTPVVPARSPDIAAEPAVAPHNLPQLAPAPSASNKGSALPTPIEPWVPSPSALAPEAAPAGNAPRPSAASFEEVREIEAARAAVSRGDAAAAIAQLNDYDSSHPNGQLKPESMALRIQVLSNSGKATEARTLANEFQGKYPEHPLVRQVRGGGAK